MDTGKATGKDNGKHDCAGRGKPVPLWVELCAGSAATTLQLLGGEHCKPPVSYQGAKTGISKAILQVLGLHPGQGADGVVLVEAGPWARAWAVLSSPEGCRAVAEVIRGWIPCPTCKGGDTGQVDLGGAPVLSAPKDCPGCAGTGRRDAKALWHELKAKGVPAHPKDMLAAWLVLSARSYGQTPVLLDGAAWSHPYGPGALTYMAPAADGAGRVGPDAASLDARLAVLSALQWPPTLVVNGDVPGVPPEDVAAWMYLHAASYGNKGPDHGFDDKQERADRGTRHTCYHPAVRLDMNIDQLQGTPWPPTLVVNGKVQDISPEDIASWMYLQFCNFGNKPADYNVSYGLDGNTVVAGGHPSVPLADRTDKLVGVPWPPALVVQGQVQNVTPADVAKWLFLHAGSFSEKGPEHGMGYPAGKPATSTFGGQRPAADELLNLVPRLEGVPWPPATLVVQGDVPTLPEWVAAWAWLQSRSFGVTLDEAGRWRVGGGYIGGVNTNPAISLDGLGDNMQRAAGVPWPVLAIACADVAGLQPGQLPEGTVVYFDPDYQNTTGYAHSVGGRQAVEDVARRWAAAGATVCVSEATPLDGLVAEGWYAVDVTDTRRGQRRTFAKGQERAGNGVAREWVTLNRAPAWVPETADAQQGLGL